MNMPDKGASLGVWTPNAMVLCLRCHGRESRFGRLMSANYQEKYDKCHDIKFVKLEPGERVTICDECSCPVIMNEAIANEHNACIILSDLFPDEGSFQMEQTGGMCSAGSWRPADGNDEYMLFVDRTEIDNFKGFVFWKVDSEGNEIEEGEGNKVSSLYELVCSVQDIIMGESF